MTTRCKTAWALYTTFSEIAQELNARGTDPKRNPAFQAALQDLRNHFKTCQECRAELNKLVETSKEHPDYAENSSI